MSRLALLTLLLICFQTVSFGQVEDIYREETPEDEPLLNFDQKRMAFKFSPLQSVMGELNLGFELRATKKISIEIEAGPTISNIGLAGGFSSVLGFESDSILSVRNSGIGFFSSVSLRYYILRNREALDGLYMAPMLKFRMYNSHFSEPSGNLESIRGAHIQAKLLINFGYQLWATKHFSLDFFVGTGFGFREEISYNTETYYENNQWNYDWQRLVDSRAQLLTTFGVKFGFGR
jgi:Protein of unknown function (DUF3575)